MAQIDFGGVPYDKIEKNIELIATEILPAIRKHKKKYRESNGFSVFLIYFSLKMTKSEFLI